MTPLELLMDACHAGNYVHFPKGLTIWRGEGNRWRVRFIREDTESISSCKSDATGATPEEAIGQLCKDVEAIVKKKVASLSSEHLKYIELANALAAEAAKKGEQQA